MTEQCFVCCEEFNKKEHSKIECKKCQYSACRACTRKYLLNSPNPGHCMNCNEEWSREFMVNNLSRSYVNGDYKKHREMLLLGTEKARLIEDMEAAAAFKEMNIHKAEQKLLNEQIRKLKERRFKTEQNIWKFKRVFQGFENPEKKRKEFIKKCPSESCNGMLSTQWKCQICELTVCPKCHEIKYDPSSGGGD